VHHGRDYRHGGRLPLLLLLAGTMIQGGIAASAPPLSCRMTKDKFTALGKTIES
jgi:hypothetical protein